MSFLKKKIVIFTEFSKKIGKGHYYRSLQIQNNLSKNFVCKIFFNKKNKFVEKEIKKNNYDLIIYDFKNYNKRLFKFKKKYIAFDNHVKFNKRLININPLSFSKKIYHGPNWYPYPKDFFFKKKNKLFKKKYTLLIIQGATDAFDNLKKILKCVNYLNIKKIERCIVKRPNNSKINTKRLKSIKINKIFKVKNISSILKNCDLVITGCGNFALETAFFGIPGVYVSSEKTEVKRGKTFQKKGLGKLFSPNDYRGIAKELNKLSNDYNYYKKIRNKKLKLFRKNGLTNITNLIKNYIYAN